MQGRAGRPQFDDSGVGVILTTSDKAKFYQSIAQGLDPVQSSLLDALEEHMTTELCLQTITDVDSAHRWLCATFLYQRMQVVPDKYGLRKHARVEDVNQFMKQLATTALTALVETHLVRVLPPLGMTTKDVEEQGELELLKLATARVTPLQPAFIMVRSYLKFSTIKAFASIPRTTSFADLVRAFCATPQLTKSIIVRRNERTVSSHKYEVSHQVCHCFVRYHAVAARGEDQARPLPSQGC